MTNIRQKILFFKLGSIGDVLMSTPLVRAVKNNNPHSEIHYMVGQHSEISIRNNPHIDKIITFDQDIFFKKKISCLVDIIRSIRKEKYSHVFILDKHFIFSLIFFLTGIKTRTGFNRLFEGVLNTKSVKYDNSMHEIDFYLKLAEINSISSYGKTIDFLITEKEDNFAKNLSSIYSSKRHIALINTGGNNPGEKTKIRMMPDSLFRGILDNIDKNHIIFLIGDKYDHEYYKRFADRSSILNIAGKCTFGESAAIMKYCDIVITTDSGPMHLASAVNNNVLSIFGPTDPRRKAPLNKGARSIWKDRENYCPDYEMYGKLKKNKSYWKNISYKEIISTIEDMLCEDEKNKKKNK